MNKTNREARGRGTLNVNTTGYSALTLCKWYGKGKLLNEVSSKSTELVGL